MKAIKQIDIYLIQKRNVKVIDVVQYDTGIQLVFNVKDFEIPSGVTATLYVQKPSGKFVYQIDDITVSGNTVTINLENQAITEHGKVPYQVSLSSGSDEISTFTGLMMVEKSLKNAGATESKTVIHAFDELTNIQIGNFRKRAETIANNVIKTIPEDYTTLDGKVDTLFNSMANAIKGYLSGTVVFADDVSPVEHEPIVRVHGKNLLPSFDAKTSNGITMTVSGDGTYTFNGTATGNFVLECNVDLPEGTYTMAAHNNVAIGKSGSDSPYIAFRSLSQQWLASRTCNVVNAKMTFTATEPIKSFMFVIPSGVTVSHFSVQLQAEIGSVVTDFEPYIEPSSVIVSVSGKNLIPKMESKTTKGITMAVYEDGTCLLNGTATEDAAFVFSFNLPAQTYSFALNNEKAMGTSTTDSPYYAFRSATNVWLMSKVCSEAMLTRTFTVFEAMASFLFVVPSGVTLTNYRIKPQLECGSTATKHEAPKGIKTITPNADGTVSGLTSLSPNMTILTDTEGVVVECEYNRDTNKVVEKMINAITALGGSV